MGRPPTRSQVTADQLVEIGNLVRTHRDRLDLSMTEAAGAMRMVAHDKLTPGTWGRWERGTEGPTRRRAAALDHVLCSSCTHQEWSFFGAYFPGETPPAINSNHDGPGTRQSSSPAPLFRLDGSWAGVWAYFDDQGEEVGFLDDITISPGSDGDRLPAGPVGFTAKVASERLFGSSRFEHTSYEMWLRVDQHGMAHGLWWSPDRDFVGVFFGYLFDNSGQLEGQWMSNHLNRDVLKGHLRWSRTDEGHDGQRLLDDKAAAKAAAEALITEMLHSITKLQAKG